EIGSFGSRNSRGIKVLRQIHRSGRQGKHFPCRGFSRGLRRPKRNSSDNARNQFEGEGENQYEHDASIACFCGNFADGEISGSYRIHSRTNPPSPRLRGESRGEGLVRLPARRPTSEEPLPSPRTRGKVKVGAAMDPCEGRARR